MVVHSPTSPGFPFVHKVSYHKALLGSFIAFWILAECLRNQGLKEARPAFDPSTRRILSDGMKLIVTAAIYLWQRRQSPHSGYARADAQDEEQPLRDLSPDAPSSILLDMTPSTVYPLHVWTARSTGLLLALGLLCALHDNLFSSVAAAIDPFTLLLAAVPLGVVFSMIISRTFFLRSFLTLQWHAVSALVCGFLIIRATFTNRDVTHPELSSVLALSFSTAIFLSSIDYVYKAHDGTFVNTLNVTVFATSFVINGLISLSKFPSVAALPQAKHFDYLLATLILAETGRDITAAFVVFHFDAAFLGVLCALGSVVVLLGAASSLMVASFSVILGSAAIIFGTLSYFHSYHRSTSEKTSDSPHYSNRIYRAMEIISFAALFISTLYTAFRPALPRYKGHTPSLWDGMQHSLVEAACPRRPLPSVSWHEPRVYHEFDNVLLVVFFSHARYNVNLDNYKKTYAPYFPNIVFVGPESREDRGFSHSFDVLVDSYQSYEDLSDPEYYKMAGRMAHHMLYTAMSAHPCYDGYLWAPFDTLLNLPRLQQFDQRYFWYHSPWGTYVPNPAFGDAESYLDKNMHAPPLRISPDPAINLTETWQGWGKDWWWGDPHMGLEVCMRAFNKVPKYMRERLSDFNGGETRLLGGSADTLYIPGRHRETFLSTLGLFLETDCFLEIATPTTVHLVSPPGDPILYVDHWWIWQSPFDGNFVRQKWAEGLEVDTFHTYHWGEKDGDGVWSETPGSVQDMRGLLKESAVRQHVDFPDM